MSKWRPPVAVQDHLERKVIYSDNRATRDVNITWTEQDYREFVQGYRCVRCYAHVDNAFPEHCPTPYCDGYPDGFPMKERQSRVLEEEFDGFEWIGLSRSTFERMQNEAEPKTTKGQSQIWVPGKD